MPNRSYSLGELARHLGAELKGDPECTIHRIASLEKAQSGEISFYHESALSDPRYKKFLQSTQASAVILSPQHTDACSAQQLIVENPYSSYAKVAELFSPKIETDPGIHPTAVIGRDCQIAANASIGAQCVVGDRVVIGEHTVLHPGTIVGNDCTIGVNCILWSRVTLYYGVRLGDRVILHSGVVIGSDGFGMANEQGIWRKIPQIGGVCIGNDVEIGANTTIDRGALDDTYIGHGVKLDNLIQIAHNVHIGDHSIIAGCSAIAGGTRIGKHCMIGGAVSINGHIEIADGVILTATAAVSSSLLEPGIYSSGLPLQSNKEWRKNSVRFKQLDDLARRLRKLEKTNP